MRDKDRMRSLKLESWQLEGCDNQMCQQPKSHRITASVHQALCTCYCCCFCYYTGNLKLKTSVVKTDTSLFKEFIQFRITDRKKIN